MLERIKCAVEGCYSSVTHQCSRCLKVVCHVHADGHHAMHQIEQAASDAVQIAVAVETEAKEAADEAKGREE